MLSTGAVTRGPDFTDQRRILERLLPGELELVIYAGWDERVAVAMKGPRRYLLPGEVDATRLEAAVAWLRRLAS